MPKCTSYLIYSTHLWQFFLPWTVTSPLYPISEYEEKLFTMKVNKKTLNINSFTTKLNKVKIYTLEPQTASFAIPLANYLSSITSPTWQSVQWSFMFYWHLKIWEIAPEIFSPAIEIKWQDMLIILLIWLCNSNT